ncbi:MAG TPA: dihydroorotase family protein [Blastocatellia bacterium]
MRPERRTRLRQSCESEDDLYDLVITGGDVVFPGKGVVKTDIGIKDGKIAGIGELNSSPAKTLNAKGLHVFPGVVDSHFHMGIYKPLAQDAETESASAVAGGVTSILIYYRAGRNNLIADLAPQLPLAYGELYPRVLKESAGKFFCDYGYNIAPVTTSHLGEVPDLVRNHGVSTFKFYMHYRGVTPEEFGAGDFKKEFLFSDTGYDLGYLRQIMEQVVRSNRVVPGSRVSVHAENPAMIRVHSSAALRDAAATHGRTNPLETYSKMRPPLAERLGILEAAELASQTGCPLNILHVSSQLALETIRQVRSVYPQLDLLAEATVHHLILTTDFNPSPLAKVNPPIRSGPDREALWLGIKDGSFQTVVSDHAATCKDFKVGGIDEAWYGFGGTELLLPSLITEGHFNRGVKLERIAELLSLSPAKIHGLFPKKGDIAIGCDADLALCDLTSEKAVDHEDLHSAQDFSPFNGLELKGWVVKTLLRGRIVYDSGAVAGPASGEYLFRPAGV